MSPTVRTEDLVDSQEVADILGLTHRNSVSTYAKRYADFPKPVVDKGVSRVRLWLQQDVRDWATRRSNDG